MPKKNNSEKKYKLPKPKYPKLDMPKNPVVAGMPEDAPHKSCDGEDYAQPDYTKSPVTPPPPGIKRIMIGIPILSYTHEFVESFLRFWTELNTAEETEYEVGYHFVYRKPVHMADQVIVDMALYNKCTHVLFIDDDITDYSKAMLDELVKADRDVIGGIMYASKFPHAMCAFRRFDTKKKVIDMPADNSMYRLYEIPCVCANCYAPLQAWGNYYCGACGAKQNNIIQKADLIPFCFTLMKTDIFAKMKQPWFHCTTQYPCDSWFSDRCIEAGIQQYAHMGCRLTHARVNDVTKPHYFNIGLEENKSKSTGLINITTEEMNKHQYLLNQKMKEAEVNLKSKTSPKFLPAGKRKRKQVSKEKLTPIGGKEDECTQKS